MPSSSDATEEALVRWRCVDSDTMDRIPSEHSRVVLAKPYEKAKYRHGNLDASNLKVVILYTLVLQVCGSRQRPDPTL